MKTWTLALLIGSSCGLVACGNVVTVEDGGPEKQPPEGIPDEPSAGAAACDFEAPVDPNASVLAWIRGRDVVILRGDGNSFVPFTFDKGLDKPWMWGQLAAQDGFVAATLTAYGDDGNTVAETVLLSAKGAVLWKSDGAALGYGNQFLGEKGTLAISSWGPDGASGYVVWPDGNVAEVPGVIPIGGPTAAGRFPALLTPDSYIQEYGWSAPGVESVPFEYGVYYGGAPVESGGVLYYLGMTDEASGSLALVAESEDATGALPLSAETAYLGNVAAPFALVRDDYIWNAPQSLANPLAGTAKSVAPPGDLSAFGMAYYNGATVDDEGSVLLFARGASAGGLYRTKDLGASWQRVGKSLSHVWDAQIAARGGTFVVAATDSPGYFPMDPWEEPAPGESPADALGPSVEVARPAEGISRSLDAAASSFVLSKTGSCLAYTAADRLRVIHVGGGADLEVGQFDPALGFALPVWIE